MSYAKEANAQPGELTLENARRFLSKVKDACAGEEFGLQVMSAVMWLWLHWLHQQ